MPGKIKFNRHPGQQPPGKAGEKPQQATRKVYTDDEIGKMVSDKIKELKDYQKVEDWILKTFTDAENCYSAGFSLCYSMSTEYINRHNILQRQRLDSLIGILNPDFIGASQLYQEETGEPGPVEEPAEPETEVVNAPPKPDEKITDEIDEALKKTQSIKENGIEVA